MVPPVASVACLIRERGAWDERLTAASAVAWRLGVAADAIEAAIVDDDSTVGMQDASGTTKTEVRAMRADVDGIPVEMKIDEIETRGVEWGEQLVRYVSLPPGVDFTPLFKGLPGDMCQCPHWGYVLSGSIRLRYEDGSEEVTSAGEAYYWPAGHTGWTDTGVTFLEFSPAAALRPVLEHLAAQLSPTN